MTRFSPSARPTVVAEPVTWRWWSSTGWKRFLDALLRALSALAG